MAWTFTTRPRAYLKYSRRGPPSLQKKGPQAVCQYLRASRTSVMDKSPGRQTWLLPGLFGGDTRSGARPMPNTQYRHLRRRTRDPLSTFWTSEPGSAAVLAGDVLEDPAAFDPGLAGGAKTLADSFCHRNERDIDCRSSHDGEGHRGAVSRFLSSISLFHCSTSLTDHIEKGPGSRFPGPNCAGLSHSPIKHGPHRRALSPPSDSPAS